MPRGGRRQGAPGRSYSNRTDLALGPRKLPMTAAPGQEYGAAKEQTDAQRVVPMSPAPLPTAAPAAGPPGAGGPPLAPVIPMAAPTMNPGEPLTTGMPAGIGQTAPTQAPLQASPALKGMAILNTLGDAASPETKMIAAHLSAAQANEAAP